MENQINIIAPSVPCERTGLPQQQRMKSLALNETGYLNISLAIDVLDNEGNVFVSENETQKVEVHPQAQYGEDGEIPPTELDPAQEVLINALKEAIQDYLETRV